MPLELPSLIMELESPDPGKRAAAAQRLAGLAEDARLASVPLVRAVADQHEQVREWATEALELIGAPPASEVGALTLLLSHGSSDVAYWAATLLGRCGEAAAPAAHDLAAVVGSDRDTAVRQRVAWALGRIGHASQPVLEALARAAASTDRRLARLAQQALDTLDGK
jgi:HEAT repeat protein